MSAPIHMQIKHNTKKIKLSYLFNANINDNDNDHGNEITLIRHK